MEQFIVLLIIGAVALVNWLSKQGFFEKKENAPPEEQARPKRYDGESEQERMRKFMEALGVPPGSAPPRKVMQRRAAQPQLPRTFKAAPKRIQVPPPTPVPRVETVAPA